MTTPAVPVRLDLNLFARETAGVDGLFGVESLKLQALTKAVLDWMMVHGGY